MNDGADVKKLSEVIKQSQNILITSHISPDPDAVSSVLLLGTTLKLNFPDKNILLALEEEIEGLDFLSRFDQIEFGNLAEKLDPIAPDLFVLLDGNNFERCSRHDGQKVRDYLKSNRVKTVVIDHHELQGADEVDVFINRGSVATVQDVYEICFTMLSLKKPQGYTQTTMAGIYADTGGFVYIKDGNHSRMFALIEELLVGGANIEEIKNMLTRYSQADLKVLSELAKNFFHKNDYNFSHLSDEFILKGEGKKPSELQKGTGIFLDEFIRNIDGRQWGFIVYRNILQGDGMYSVSLRSVGGVKDVAKIAVALGGGGHKPAAGAKFPASSIEEAIERVQNAISST